MDYRTLKQAIQNGLMVMQTHRILKFNQSRWLKKYIDFNNDLRNKSKTKFGRDTFKLIINAVFGKPMENVENCKDIKLITSWANAQGKVDARALIARHNFKSRTVFTKAYYVSSLNSEIKKAKGIKKSVIENELHLEEYQKNVERPFVVINTTIIPKY